MVGMDMVGMDMVDKQAEGGLGSMVIPGMYSVVEFTGLSCDTGEPFPSSNKEALCDKLV